MSVPSAVATCWDKGVSADDAATADDEAEGLITLAE